MLKGIILKKEKQFASLGTEIIQKIKDNIFFKKFN